MSRFAIVPFVALVSVAPLGLIGCQRARGVEAAGATPPTVAVVKPTRGSLEQVLTVTAGFRPFQEIEVHSKVAGFLKAIYVDVGDRVREGQLLAELEVPEMQDEQRQDEASVNRAQSEIGRAQADLERAESVHEIAHLNATRLQGVQKARPNLIALQDIDDAVSRDRVAEAQVATAKAAVSSAQQQLAMSRATQGRTRTLSGYTRLSAPFAGVVSRRYADKGAMIQAGTASQTQAMPIVRLSQVDVLRLVIPVPESAVTRIKLGAPVTVRVATLDKTFEGRVARFASKLDEQTRTMHTEVDVKNPTLELVPGMYASAAITLASKSDALTVPVQTVERSGAKTSVFVVDGKGTVQVRSVTLGMEAADKVEVTAGLQEGDLIVAGNRSQLKAGTTVVAKTEAPAVRGGK